VRALVALLLLTSVSACSWFASHRSTRPRTPTEIVITGAPRTSLILVDGVQAGQAVTRNDQSEILDVAPGPHKVEITLNEAIVYREDVYVGSGERRVVSVLSGLPR
jgi:hypothetical protein